MRFRKRPVVIDAVNFTGSNYDEVKAFCPRAEYDPMQPDVMFILTLEGTMRVDPADWVIRGVNGEFYPCKPDIFLKTYDPA